MTRVSSNSYYAAPYIKVSFPIFPRVGSSHTLWGHFVFVIEKAIKGHHVEESLIGFDPKVCGICGPSGGEIRLSHHRTELSPFLKRKGSDRQLFFKEQLFKKTTLKVSRSCTGRCQSCLKWRGFHYASNCRLLRCVLIQFSLWYFIMELHTFWRMLMS